MSKPKLPGMIHHRSPDAGDRSLVPPMRVDHRTPDVTPDLDKGPRLTLVTRPQDFDAEANKKVPIFLLYLPDIVKTFYDLRRYARDMEATLANSRWWDDIDIRDAKAKEFVCERPFLIMPPFNEPKHGIYIRHVGQEDFLVLEETLDDTVPDGFAVACINPAYKLPPLGGHCD